MAIGFSINLLQYLPRGDYPDSKVHVAIIGPTWVLSAPDGAHVGPMNFAISVNTDPACRQ